MKEHICVDSTVMLGKPTVRGTRITVELVLRKLAEGATETDLIEAYPQLTPEAIHAAMEYAADALAHEELASSAERVQRFKVQRFKVAGPDRIWTFPNL